MKQDSKLRAKRRWLKWLGGAVVLVGAGVLFRKPLLRTALSLAIDNDQYDVKSVSFVDSDMCVVTSRTIEGPFYVPSSPLRSDIRDGQLGQKLKLRLKFVDSVTCKPLVGGAVHIWHANAAGRYSGYEGHSPDEVELIPGHLPVETEQRFLRGHQITNEAGIVEFTTIVPAWYSFRTPHIHVKVLLPKAQSLTTQIYFPETINIMVRETVARYKTRPSPLVTNRSDPVISASKGAPGGLLKVAQLADVLEGTLTLGVQFEALDTAASLSPRPPK